MSRFTEVLHAITGRLGQDPLGDIPYVALVPDDYLPELVTEGFIAVTIAAGGAGMRSEIALYVNDTSQAVGIELTGLMVATGTAAGNIHAGFTPAALGGTFGAPSNQPTPAPYADWYRTQARDSKLVIKVSNGAAASTVTKLAGNWMCGVANVMYPVPGRVILRGGQNGSMIVRPASDNQSVYFFAKFRALEKRSL